MNGMDYLYLDIETLDWIPANKDLSKIRFGIGVTRETGEQARTWQTTQASDLARYLLHASAEKIVGWNIVDFDLRVLEYNTGIMLGELRGRVFDLMREIRDDTNRWYKLDVVAQANLQRAKIGRGDQAVAWLNSGDPNQIEKACAYCRDDVELVIQLHEKILRGEPLRLPARGARNEHTDYWWMPGKVEYALGDAP